MIYPLVWINVSSAASMANSGPVRWVRSRSKTAQPPAATPVYVAPRTETDVPVQWYYSLDIHLHSYI